MTGTDDDDTGICIIQYATCVCVTTEVPTGCYSAEYGHSMSRSQWDIDGCVTGWEICVVLCFEMLWHVEGNDSYEIVGGKEWQENTFACLCEIAM